MASAYSQPAQYAKISSGWNNELIDKGMAYKQQSYDQNFAKLQNFYNNYSDLDLLKDEDREYFQDRLQTLKSQVDKYGTGDLSVAGTAEQLASYIGQAQDEKVENGYAGTLMVRNYMSEWNKIKEDDPERFSQTNFEFGLQNVQKWMNDGQVGTKLTSYKNPRIGAGVGEVIPYVDKAALATEVIKELEPNAYVTLTPMGGFAFYKESGEVLEDETIKNAVKTMVLSKPQVQQQMAVDSWTQFRGLSDEQFAQTYRSVASPLLSEINNREKQLLKKKALYPSRAAEYDQLIQSVRDEKRQAQNTISMSTQDIASQRPEYEKLLHQNQFVNSIADVYKYKKIKDKGFETNPYAKAQWEERNKERRFQMERLDEINLDLVEARTKGEMGKVNYLANKKAQLTNKDSGDILTELEENFTALTASTTELPQVSTADRAAMFDQRKIQATKNFNTGFSRLLNDMYSTQQLKKMGVLNDKGLINTSDEDYVNFANEVFEASELNDIKKVHAVLQDKPEEERLQLLQAYSQLKDEYREKKKLESYDREILSTVQNQVKEELTQELQDLEVGESYDIPIMKRGMFGGTTESALENLRLVKNEQGNYNIVRRRRSITQSGIEGRGTSAPSDVIIGEARTVDEAADLIIQADENEYSNKLLEAKAQRYQDEFGDQVTGVEFELTKESAPLFTTLLNQTYSGEEAVPEQFRSQDVLFNALTKKEKGDDREEVPQATVRVNPYGQTVVNIEGSGDFVVNPQELPDSNPYKRTLQNVTTNANVKLSNAASDSYFLEKMNKAGAAKVKEATTTTIIPLNENILEPDEIAILENQSRQINYAAGVEATRANPSDPNNKSVIYTPYIELYYPDLDYYTVVKDVRYRTDNYEQASGANTTALINEKAQSVISKMTQDILNQSK